MSATGAGDAWFGLGYACAADRLWQMEWDRRRAIGRTAEVVGPAGVAADLLARRLQLEASARRDVDAMSPATRAAFEAYAAGVNACVEKLRPLPPEFGLTGLSPEPWEPWHSVAAFKIRHVFMGTWQVKLVQAQLLVTIGPEAYGGLGTAIPDGAVVVLPVGGAYRRLVSEGLDELRDAATLLGFLGAHEGGSNSWAIHGSRTASGLPILCNDAHRQLDVPNVYWQAHLTCQEFEVVGATLAGLPGFPHFGHNGSVAWSITHAMADCQDLYVEAFDPATPGRYRVPGGWETAGHIVDTIAVKGAAPVTVDLWTTRHGPIVHGNPTSGSALALRYTATDGPCRTFEVLGPMLAVRSVDEFLGSQREWVDPVNNLVCADVSGNIGYLTRGALPIRSSQRHRQFPAAGWTGENEWVGRVDFNDLPRMVNPPEGFIATANQPILEGDEPYIAHSFAEPYRAERIVELLSAGNPIDVESAAAMQADVTSTAARRWVRFLRAEGPLDGKAELGRVLLGAWDGRLDGDNPAALLYGCFRREVAQALFEPVIGTAAWEWLVAGGLPAHQYPIRRWLATIVSGLDRGAAPPDGSPWSAVLQRALGAAWAAAEQLDGPDPRRWRWDDVHRLGARHPLSGEALGVGGAFDPPPVGLAGDGDTIRCAAYAMGGALSFAPTLLSVYRQVVDLGDLRGASYVLPGGASGVPSDPHFLDQLDVWARAERIPMLDGAEAGAITRLVAAGPPGPAGPEGPADHRGRPRESQPRRRVVASSPRTTPARRQAPEPGGGWR